MRIITLAVTEAAVSTILLGSAAVDPGLRVELGMAMANAYISMAVVNAIAISLSVLRGNEFRVLKGKKKKYYGTSLSLPKMLPNPAK